jgi:tRNA (guanine-N7-)-methyltransferase
MKELLIPFTWAERRPVLLEKCLYLPSHSEAEHFGPLSFHLPGLFEKAQPLAIEYCSGNGAWVLAAAEHVPHFNWIAVERDFYRARLIYRKLFRKGLKNLFVVCGEALEFTKAYLSDQSVEEAYVHFPDPWPKRRHAKHRLILPPFANELKRVLKGAVTLVTDDRDTSERMIGVFTSWKSAFAPHGFTLEEQPQFTISYFHALWKKAKREIRTHRFTHG